MLDTRQFSPRKFIGERKKRPPFYNFSKTFEKISTCNHFQKADIPLVAFVALARLISIILIATAGASCFRFSVSWKSALNKSLLEENNRSRENIVSNIRFFFFLSPSLGFRSYFTRRFRSICEYSSCFHSRRNHARLRK